MSLTQVYTETTDGRTASARSISLRGRPPHPPLNTDPSRKSFDKADEIELAQLGATEGVPGTGAGVGTGETPPVEPDVPSKVSKWAGRIQFLTLCWTLFVAGWNDGTTGPLLSRMQENYHVGCYPSGNVPWK